MRTKKCTKCGEVKAVSEFHKDKYSKDGFFDECKECRKKYYQANKEKILEYDKQYRQANKEKIKEYSKKYYQANKEKRKKYRQANKEKIKEQKKKYRQANKEKEKEQKKKYYQANKEKILEYSKKYCQDNRNKLADPYVIDIIRHQTNSMLKAKDIPQELIELKRNSLILKRKIKDNGKKTTNL